MGRKNMNRLERHGEEYQLNESFKKVALKKMLVGKILDELELSALALLGAQHLFERVDLLALLRNLREHRRHLRSVP